MWCIYIYMYMYNRQTLCMPSLCSYKLLYKHGKLHIQHSRELRWGHEVIITCFERRWRWPKIDTFSPSSSHNSNCLQSPYSLEKSPKKKYTRSDAPFATCTSQTMRTLLFPNLTLCAGFESVTFGFSPLHFVFFTHHTFLAPEPRVKCRQAPTHWAWTGTSSWIYKGRDLEPAEVFFFGNL